jgi:hypothetical protein
MDKPLVLVNKVNEILLFSVRQVDWNNFDEWVEDRERKLQIGVKFIGSLVVTGYSIVGVALG